MIIHGDSRHIPLADGVANCIVTSPPYYSKRVYHGLKELEWGEWRGHLGLEPSVDMYVDHLVSIFRGMRRVLHPSGTLWVVIGDSYSGSGGAGGDYNKGGIREGQPRYPRVPDGDSIKPKDLMLVPHRFALAMQDDGWWLRADVVWAKGRDGKDVAGNYGPSYPSSARDRPTISHEYVFMFAASRRYAYDYLGSRVEHERGSHTLRSVWLINSGNSGGGKHFAAYPSALVEQVLRTVPKVVCPICSVPFRREANYRPKPAPTQEAMRQQERCDGVVGGGVDKVTLGLFHGHWTGYAETLGWKPECGCGADGVPPLVLDPFSGTGTTGEACTEVGMRYVGVDLSPDYNKIAKERVG